MLFIPRNDVLARRLAVSSALVLRLHLNGA
jgi:hypothetical protein